MKKPSIPAIGVLFLVILAVLLGAITQPALAQESHPVHIYLFWGEGCPHCAAAKPYFESLVEKYPGVQLHMYEIYNSTVNQELFSSMAEKYNFQPSGVPTFFIAQYYSVGWTEDMNTAIEDVIRTCLKDGCPDPGEGIVSHEPVQVTAQPTPQPTIVVTPTPTPAPSGPMEFDKENTIDLPIFGEVDLTNTSLFLSTLLISFVDGFNPCSLWVLSILLTLTLHTGSRRKVLIIGLIFIAVTGAIYALFIAGLFSVLKVVSFLGWIQVVIALVALFFALVNIKDYFWYKEGLSFTIADEKKTGIARGIRRVMDAGQSFWGLAGATVVLAAGVSLVEFSCTAGFPVLWSNLVSAQGVTAGVFVLLLLLYMVIYQLDELIIFGSAVITLRASRLEEKHGRILKLISGMLMLTLAVVMLVDPTLMNTIKTSLLVFGIALAATLLVLLVHRVILPRFGIWIGTEKIDKSPKTRH